MKFSHVSEHNSNQFQKFIKFLRQFSINTNFQSQASNVNESLSKNEYPEKHIYKPLNCKETKSLINKTKNLVIQKMLIVK